MKKDKQDERLSTTVRLSNELIERVSKTVKQYDSDKLRSDVFKAPNVLQNSLAVRIALAHYIECRRK